MPCYRPLDRYMDVRGNQVFFAHEDDAKDTSLLSFQNTVPCRSCFGCRMRKRLEWTIRGCHELQMKKDAVFMTLTYRNEDLPSDWSISKDVAVAFVDRLKANISYYCKKNFLPKPKMSYFICGEYGEKTDRPHYHCIFYGWDFPDRVQHGESVQGHKYYRSPMLEKSWKFGNSSFGAVSFQSVAYVAKYAMKKITGDMAEEHYKKTHRLTGEVFTVQPEFHTASYLGKDWFEKYQSDVFPRDEVAFEGKLFPVPKYYLDRLEKQDPGLHAVIKTKRAKSYFDEDGNFVVNSNYKDAEYSVQRLADMEKCKLHEQEKYLLDKDHLI